VSIPVKQKYICYGCKKEEEITIWQSINVSQFPEMKPKILDGTFFSHTCSDCNYTSRLYYNCLYHDMDNQQMVWIVPSDNFSEKFISDIRAGYILPGYTCRIVDGPQSLTEKIYIWAAGKDDRYMEMYKLLLKDSFYKQNPNAEPMRLYYYSLSDRDVFGVFTEPNKMEFAQYNNDSYNQMRDLFEASHIKDDYIPYPIIDELWAAEIFEQINKQKF
jgi:hypothetical protein